MALKQAGALLAILCGLVLVVQFTYPNYVPKDTRMERVLFHLDL